MNSLKEYERLGGKMKDLKNVKMKSQKGDEFNVSFVIGKELHDKLKKLAYQYDICKSEVIRQILEIYVDEKLGKE